MRKLGGILLIGVLALTACSTAKPEPVGHELQPFAATAPSATAEITAAPIPAQTTAEDPPATGDFGDPAADAEFLARVKSGWKGEIPNDDALIAAARFACQEYEAGKHYDEMRPVAGDTDAELDNGIAISAYAGRVYCTEYSPFRD